MFEQAFLPEGHGHQGRCAAFAFTGEVGVVLIAALMMTYGEVVPMRFSQETVALMLSPPPPPPPAAVRAPARTVATRLVARTFVAPVFTAPQTIPQHALIIADAEPPMPDMPGGVIGGVPGGVPGGSLNGLLGALPLPAPVAPSTPPKPAATPAAPTTPTQIRVGGAVEAALLTREVAPVYPLLAKQSRVEGTVQLSAIIAPDGTVKDLRVLSGNPLLVEAARNAVKQWIYRPTYLNGHPVEVLTEIEVKFALV